MYITPNEVNIQREFKELFIALPLELHQNITNKIWNGGEEYNAIIVGENHHVIPLSLRFLFSMYGRPKSTTLLECQHAHECGKETRYLELSIGLFLGNNISEQDH